MDGEEDEVESDWSEEDTRAVYKEWKERKKNKRKRVAAETNRIRAQKKSKIAAAAASSIVGRKPTAKKKQGHGPTGFSTDSVAEDADVYATFLDDPIPDYITSRQKDLKKLHESGLRYPPGYKDVDLGLPEKEERPVLDKAIMPQREKKNIKLHESGGIIPAPIAQWLRDYQIEGVQFLHEKFVKQTGAILGDDMGLGKTIQVIAFLTVAFGKKATKNDARCMRQFRLSGQDRWYPRILIVCPGTLMQNWEDELAKWGWWEVYRYHGGTAADRKGVLGAATKGMLEIMITTYITYRNHESEINTVDWDCVVADECHQIKSKNAEITKAMNKINALCRIGLTGTAIQNKYEELWNLLNWARPGAYGSAQEWKQTISLPLKLGQAHDATNAQLADSRSRAQDLVHKILPSVFLRRMKTLIAHQLPKKSDRIIFCQLTETQADSYRTFLESDRCHFIQTAREECDCGSGRKRGWCCYQEIPDEGGKWSTFIFPCMVTLQKLANHLALIVPQSSETKEKQGKDTELLQIACPGQWEDLYRIRDNILHQSQREFCGKWKVLRRLLDFWHSNGDKVLIFSHSVRLLRLLRGLFDIDGTKYNFTYLDGSMKYEDRSKAVADFNADPNQFVFLISTKAGGVGLNITSANKVVIVDPHWNPAYDLQAQDRAYRIGQTRDVEVFRLVSSGTIEEIVYARQIYKQQQANIGYNASEERRYFKGVMDQSSKKGELFGLENLFTFQESSVLLRDIMHKTNIAESKAGINAVDFNFDESQLDSDDDDILSNKSLGIADEDVNLGEMQKLVDSFTSTTSSTSTKGKIHSKKFVKRGGPDPINAILAKAGVQYTHENSEVIGRSEVEARLGKQAMELRNDIDLSSKRVFQASQSQSQSQHTPHFHPFSHQAEEEIEYSEDDEDDVKVVGSASKGEFKINYRYRPDERIRKRQFCSMTESMGFDDPVEFALLVESSTQEERRKMLERFYRGRRRELTRDLESRKVMR
ncbi:P-loop containing nucleoside triphosphate hydrolase protein [Ampelomyces quisqualis]|uniref:P-loop containing nucleoside triphosphate hydrolase protein n=1 Tax=Ampelomyces quisqualis TaxID=50730 RepID=A0A6A5QMC2_AMPQU|nr:P-loop containing nucleoside triphosphate hydrolase protein [Ampelomyces quisqualis]